MLLFSPQMSRLDIQRRVRNAAARQSTRMRCEDIRRFYPPGATDDCIVEPTRHRHVALDVW